jgi:hypothetical protein
MSFDLMLFNLKKAPPTQKEFIDWFNELTKWGENHNYDNPNITTETLKEVFKDLTDIFPPMNGPFADENRDPVNSYLTDYCIGEDFIYLGFSWSLASEAYTKCIELTRKYELGFFNPSDDDGDLYYGYKGELFYMYSEK